MRNFFVVFVSILLISRLEGNVSPDFQYDLHLIEIHKGGKDLMICFHGMGGDYRIVNDIEPYLPGVNLVGFNFPDFGKFPHQFNPHESSFGTVKELLPAIYVLDKYLAKHSYEKVILYGYSAGGAALLNSLIVLNGNEYNKQLNEIGISVKRKKQILQVIQNAWIILDTPLKSIDEVLERHGMTEHVRVLGSRYRDHHMVPIENTHKIGDLSLKILVHFQNPDEVLSNRDDDLFIEKLKKYNSGETLVLKGTGEGHMQPHPTLWKYYLEKLAK